MRLFLAGWLFARFAVLTFPQAARCNNVLEITRTPRFCCALWEDVPIICKSFAASVAFPIDLVLKKTVLCVGFLLELELVTLLG